MCYFRCLLVYRNILLYWRGWRRKEEEGGGKRRKEEVEVKGEVKEKVKEED